MLQLLPLITDNVDVLPKNDNNGNSLILAVLLLYFLIIDSPSIFSTLALFEDLVSIRSFFAFIGLELALHDVLFCGMLESDRVCSNLASSCEEYRFTTDDAAV